MGPDKSSPARPSLEETKPRSLSTTILNSFLPRQSQDAQPSPATRSRALSRILSCSALIALGAAILYASPIMNSASEPAVGALGGVIRRANSPTDVCTRWAHQSALVNGTVYIYGGQATTSAGQTQNTWNNNFVSIDVTKTWQISSPAINGVAQPSGPPPVAEGYLWNSFDSLFLYGGEYSWQPITTPSPYAMWSYDIKSSKWTEHSDPKTDSGSNSDTAKQAVLSAAEGAGISVPEIGRGFYFGGHLDGYTVPGWSQSVPRVYLKSMIEFTYPGATNKALSSLSKGQAAGPDGAWRNITQGGIQSSSGFPERADGVLVYVPGFGDLGIILGLAGGTNTTFTELNEIDVFDIASSTWYKQATSGSTPQIRVNPCAVAASAPDGSSTNVYMYGGQNLQPADAQTQLNDTWILSVPGFIWIAVNASTNSGQSVPPARAGHTCHMWDGQMVVVGGYVGAQISCDSPGVYVFNASSLQWANQFTSLSHANDQGTLDTQAAQVGSANALPGSYGYQVPAAVVNVIGGNGNGGATVTAPIATPSPGGPLATGKPITYSVAGAAGSVYVTVSNGHTITATAMPASTGGAGGGGSSSNNNNGGSSGPNIGAIVAGVIAGILALIIVYLIVCLVIYRRQLQLYKNHVAMAQRQAAGRNALGAGSGVSSTPGEKTAFLGVGAAAASSRARTSESGSHGQVSSGDESAQASWGISRDRESLQQQQQPFPGRDGVPLMPDMAAAGGAGAGKVERTGSVGSEESVDLLLTNEPTFVGVMLHPRRSLRIVNK